MEIITMSDFRVTEKWITESLLPRVQDLAQRIGVDASTWSFGRHFGLSWTLARPEGSGMAQLAIWSKLSEAAIGLEGMAKAYELAAEQLNR
jgi:hypothetical protein